MYFDFSNISRYIRLSSYNLNENKRRSQLEDLHLYFDKVVKKTEYTEFQKLIIFGDNGTGKSTLAFGIGTELAILRYKVFYTTMVNFLDIVSEGKTHQEFKTLQDSYLLIIDDICFTKNIKHDMIRYKDFENIIKLYDPESTILNNRNIVFVIGSSGLADEWKTNLLTNDSGFFVNLNL